MHSILLIPAGLALALGLAAMLLALAGASVRRLPALTRGPAALAADRLLLAIAGALFLAGALAACVVASLLHDFHLAHHLPHLCLDGLFAAPAGGLAVAAAGATAALALVGACRHAWRAHRAQQWWRQAASRGGAGLSPKAASAVETARRRLGVAFAGISEVDVPGRNAFVFGVRRPHCVLTRSLVARLSPEEIEAVVAHEAAHLRQWDPLVRLALAACRRVFGFLPPVRALLTAWEEAAEMAADDLAAEAAGCRLALASALLAASRGCRAPGLPLVEGSAALVVRRVERLLAHAPPASSLVWRRRAGIAAGLAITALALVAAMHSPLFPSLHCLVENLLAEHTLCPR